MYHDHAILADKGALQSRSAELPSDINSASQFGAAQHELQAGFELPSSVWTGMLACYAIFFLAIFAATGGSGKAVFAIAVSVLYTAMYFGLSKVLSGVGGAEKPSPLDRGEDLQTWTGAMNRKAVFGQVLIVPFCVALFGVLIAVICAVVLP